MKKLLFTLTLVLAAMTAAAQTFTVGNLTYTVTNGATKTVSVKKAGAVEGKLVIPSKVTNEGVSYTVTSVVADGFSGTGITSVTIPSTVESLGNYAFANCASLGEVTIQDGDVALAMNTDGYYNPFKNSTADKTVYIGRNLDKISFSLFSNVTEVKFGDKVTFINNNLFRDNTKLASIIIGKGVTTIGSTAFYNTGTHESVGEQSVTIGSNVTLINSGAFQNCSKLYSITLPAVLKNINESAFYSSGLTSISIPASVDSLGFYAFGNCSSLAKVRFENSDNALKIHTDVYYNPFKNSTADKTVYIGRNLARIAFAPFINATSVEFSDNVTAINSNLFKDVKKLSSITIGNNVTTIGASAFYNTGTDENVGEQTVTMGSNVTTIDGWAFQYCSNLQSIALPAVLQVIKEAAFANTSLTSITIPASVDSLGFYAFANCASLAEVKIMDSGNALKIHTDAYYNPFKDSTADKTVYIGRNLARIGFAPFINATSVEFSDNVTVINNNLFNGVKKLSNIFISNSVTTIGTSAFYNTGTDESVGEQTVTMGTNVTTIDSWAFQNCANLKSITLPSVLKKINEAAFNSTGLTSITIPASVDSLGYYAFAGCSSLAEIVIEDNANALKMHTDSYYNPFKSSEADKTVYIGRNLDKIAFAPFVNATSVVFSDKVTAINNSLFYAGKKLANITISNSVTSIGKSAFYNTGTDESIGEQTVTMGTNVTTIDSWAFQNCANLKSITLPAVLKKINEAAFNSTGLTSITIPASVDSLGYYAFGSCASLAEVKIMDSDNALKMYTDGYYNPFKSSNADKTVYIGRDLARIGFTPFANATSVVFSDKVTAINNNLFKDAKKLASITIGSGVKTIGQYAFYNTGTDENVGEQTVTMGSNVTTIDGWAFQYCSKLQSIAMPAVLQVIKEAAFANTGLTSITIPASVESLGNYAFSNCENLASIRFEDSDIALKMNTDSYYNPFKNSNAEKTIYMGRNFAVSYALLGKVSSIEFGTKVTEIKPNLLSGSTQTSVTANWLQPLAITENTFNAATYNGATLWVPSGTIPAYKGATGWKNFLNMDCAYYYVNLQANKNGTITAGDISASNGTASALFNRETDVVVTIKADNGYRLQSLTVNGTAVQPANGVYIISNLLADQTVVATFAPINYTLTYNLAGGALPEGKTNPATYTIESNAITLVNPVRTGYTFEGWTGTGLENPTKTVTIAKGSMGNRSYTATWKVINYTISYDLAGGSLPADKANPTAYTVESNAITLVNPTRTGYTFEGWTGTGLENPTKTVTIAKGSTGNRSYKATWKAVQYTISYNLAGGALPQGLTNPATYTAETATFTLVNPVQEGYTFQGWTGTGLEQATMSVTIAKGSMGNRSYTATWKQNDPGPGPEPEPVLAQGILSVTQLANMNTPRISHQILPTEDGFAVFGGHTTGFAMTMTAERYNNAAGTWTQMNMPNYHDYSGSIVLDDGQLLLLGGMSSNLGVGASNKCDIYNPQTNGFSSAGNLVQPRSMCFADMTDSGDIYLMGCWYNSSYSVECYDQVSKSFTKAADGFKANMPYVFAMRNEKVAIIDESRMVVVQNGTQTEVQNDLLKEYPVRKSWFEAQMADHKVAKYSGILVGYNTNRKEAVLLNVFDDPTEGIKVRKIADLPMTLPNDEGTEIEYMIERTRIYCKPADNKIFIQTHVTGNRKRPVIVEYTYPNANKIDGGRSVVYTVPEALPVSVDVAAWASLADGSFVSTGGTTNNDSRENYNAVANTYIYKLVGGVYCDVNGDGSVDVADIATIISVMAGSAQEFRNTADVNNDGTVDVADIATVITRMAELARLQRQSLGDE